MLIAGVDEVGRGPLVGNVVAAAVILKENHGIEGLGDSKKLSEKKRNSLYERITNEALSYCIAFATPKEIDAINILQASLLAMKRAVEGLSVEPEKIMVDGTHLPDLKYPMEAIPKGDSLIESISAASIIAKVTRDREMLELDKLYPDYGFASHKGYPTKLHLEKLHELGVLKEHHRRSFSPVAKVLAAEFA
jgi:ribonuclease HII